MSWRVHRRDSHPDCGVRGFLRKVTYKLRFDKRVGISLRKKCREDCSRQGLEYAYSSQSKKVRGVAAWVVSGGLG